MATVGERLSFDFMQFTALKVAVATVNQKTNLICKS